MRFLEGHHDDDAADVDRIRREAGWTRADAVHLTGSALVVHPPTGRVLLRWHEGMQRWLQVGGHADPGEEDPLAIALREGREETDLTDLRPLGPHPVQIVVVPVPARGDEPAHEHADVRYVLVTDRPDEARPENARAPLRWLDVDDAIDEVEEENLRECLRRVRPLLGRLDP